MIKYILIFAVVFLMMNFVYGCSKKKSPQDSNKPAGAISGSAADVNSVTDVNDPKLKKAIEKTIESQTKERRPRDQ